TGELSDLARAIEVYEQAVEQTPTGSPDLPSRLNNLGTGLRARYARTGELSDLARAIEVYETACQKGQDAALEEALRAARNWGGWASEREEWAEAGRAYDYGMAAIERLYRVQLTRRAKETWLREARGLPTHAGYAHARAGNSTNAVLALERGRARLLSEVLERDRADLSALEQAHPDNYAAYRRAADRVSALSGRELRPAELPPDFDLGEALRAARAELDAAIESIRALPGYTDFMDTPDWEDVARAVTPGQPLIYLAVSPAGTVALVVTPTAVHPVHCPLTEDALREHIQGSADDPELGGYLGAYARWLAAPRVNRAERNAARQTWFAALDDTAHWLWDALMGPVVRTLADLEVDHVTLIPSGWLAFLPLHAAWTDSPSPALRERGPGGEGRTYALDTVTFSYVPSACALAHAQSAAAAAPGARLFAVDNPDGSLVFSRQEVDAVARQFAGEETAPWVVRGHRATRNTALHALPECDVYHFSCHGSNAWNAPLESALGMYGRSLTVRHLLEQKGTQARLAFLSACETGLVGADLPNEVVGLASSFLQAGAAGVVSTLWAVGQVSTALLAERFYAHWKGDGMEPADALAAAQRWLRDEADGGQWSHPYYWAGFTLTGV
ncbi:MAG: CHAT domain-containing protein, partial [Chloroflexota bacterium]|nr:CHAT domain-containing protein [Chloroflexota bacterium]